MPATERIPERCVGAATTMSSHRRPIVHCSREFGNNFLNLSYSNDMRWRHLFQRIDSDLIAHVLDDYS